MCPVCCGCHLPVGRRRARSSAELSARAKFTREYVLEQFLTTSVEDKFDLDKAIQTKAEFSCAIAVWTELEAGKTEMHKRNGWVQDSLRACGSTPKLSCAMDRTTCKTLGSSN